jgi:hypothetical protein
MFVVIWWQQESPVYIQEIHFTQNIFLEQLCE